MAETRGESMNNDMETYVRATDFIDSKSPEVTAFAERICPRQDAGHKEKAIRLYYAVRDEIRYDPYSLRYSAESLKASTILREGSGYCVAKAVVLAAVGRQQGIPSRLGFADVRNHLSTARLREVMGTDIFFYHGYTEFFLEGRWVKATPAFNLSLCRRFQVKPLEFNGEDDSIFHECNMLGQQHMQYLRDHGSFADLPFEKLFTTYREKYPLIFEQSTAEVTDFHQEAEKETR